MTVAHGKVLRVSARFRDALSGDVVNVFYVLTNFATPQAEADVMTALDTNLTASYGNFDQHMISTTEPVDLKVDVVEFQAGKWVVTQNVGLTSWGAGLTTAETNDALPPGSAVLLKLRTGLGKHWGRKFFGAFTELNNVVGYVSSALQTAVLAFGTGMLSPITISAGNTMKYVVPDTVYGLARYVTEVAVNSIWSYQRRRRTAVGS